jgi:HK97 family phage portal protein
MPVISSFGSLQRFDSRALTPPPPSAASWVPAGITPPRYTNMHSGVYARIYAEQPAVRTCVDFLARNIAQLTLSIYRRVSDTDRERLVDHELAQWLAQPNPSTTRYRLFESLMGDLGIYFAAYWLKVRRPDGQVIGFVRLPPETMSVDGWLQPIGFAWTTPNGQIIPLDVRDVAYFNGYNPLNPLAALSPIETLRRGLQEYAAAGDYRSAYWRNAARHEGVIERPLSAPKWNKDQRDQFRQQWQQRQAGAANAGLTAVLEEGMTFKATAFSMRDSEYVTARKLTREEVANEYHIPPPMVGILDHATFSNIREQHKQLYADTLGPWLGMISEEVERQCLVECRDTDRVYTEFNIAEKLKGSFEEQAAALQSSVGRPIMTANEGRARLNLPSIKDDATADQLAQPYNVGMPGQQQPLDPNASAAIFAPTLRATWLRQASWLARLPETDHARAFSAYLARWDTELAADLAPLYRALGHSAESADRVAAWMAGRVNARTLQLLDAGEDPFPAAREVADV